MPKHDRELIGQDHYRTHFLDHAQKIAQETIPAIRIQALPEQDRDPVGQDRGRSHFCIDTQEESLNNLVWAPPIFVEDPYQPPADRSESKEFSQAIST